MKPHITGIVAAVIAALLIISVPLAAAQGSNVTMYIFHGEGCPHCAALLAFMEGVQERHPGLTVKTYEVYRNAQSREFFQQMSDAFGKPIEGVPTVFLADQVFVGFNKQLGEAIEQNITYCESSQCPSPAARLASYITPPPSEEESNGTGSGGIPATTIIGLGTVGILIAAAIVLLIRNQRKKETAQDETHDIPAEQATSEGITK